MAEAEDEEVPMATVNGKSTSSLLPEEVEEEIRQIVEEFGVESVQELLKTIKKEYVAAATFSSNERFQDETQMSEQYMANQQPPSQQPSQLHQSSSFCTTTSTDDDEASVASSSHCSSHSSASSSSSGADYFSRHNSRLIQQAMLESSFDAQLAVNQKGIIKHVNKAAVQQFGYSSKEELVGQNIKMIVGGGHAKFHDDYLQEFQQTRVKRLIGSMREVAGRRKDGSEFPCIIGIEVISMEHKSSKSNSTNKTAMNEKLLYFASIQDITKQKEAEYLQKESLRDQQIRAAILDTAFDSMLAINLDGTIQLVNKAAVEQFGHDSQEELLGQNINCIVGGGHANFHDDYLKRYRETGQAKLIGTMREMSARKKDGTEFPVVIGIQRVEQPEQDDNKSTSTKLPSNNSLMVAFVRDITLQKKTEEEQRIRSVILDTAFDSVFAINLDGTIQLVNKAAVEQFGYDSQEELLGQNIKCIVGGDHSDSHDDYIKRYKETGEARLIGSLRDDLMAKRKDGTEFPAVIGLQRVEREDKDNPLMVAFLRDITRRKQAEYLQKESVRDQQIRAAILDASFDALFAIDTFGIIKLVNKAALIVFGYSSTEELLGKNIHIIVGGGHADYHDDYLREYRKTGNTHIIGSSREVSARRKDGTEFPIVLGIERIDDDDTGHEALLVAFVRDVSFQKKTLDLEVEIRAAQDLLSNMLPEEIAYRLMEDPQHIADHHEKATILFADIVGFTAMSATMSPVDLVQVLNDLFTRFDELVEKYGLNKVKTIGDCYMVTSIPSSHHNPENGATAMCHLSLDMLDALYEFNDDNPDNKLDLRVGINTGPVVAGVVGTSRFLYDLWGDSVNLASRMESTGIPSRVQVTQSVVDCVPETDFDFEPRGEVHVKGKGMVHSFFIRKRSGPRGKYYVDYESDEEASIMPPIVSGLPEMTARRRSGKAMHLQDALKALHASVARLDALNASYSTGISGAFSFDGGRTRRTSTNISTNMSVISAISEDEHCEME